MPPCVASDLPWFFRLLATEKRDGMSEKNVNVSHVALAVLLENFVAYARARLRPGFPCAPHTQKVLYPTRSRAGRAG